MADARKFEVVPVPGSDYKGRPTTYVITKDGVPEFEVSSGGTGPCWNIDNAPTPLEDRAEVVPMHMCDLDETIAALEALRDSEAHRENVKRWE